MPAIPDWGDKRFEIMIGRLLRYGVFLAAAWVLVGGIHYLLQFHGTAMNYRVFHGESADLRFVREIVRGAAELNARGFIQLGILLLIATPVARVAFSVVGFALEKDWLYVGITLIVLALLIYSLSS
ncbi:MAG TPA: DUF1634 domain-containing protein [Candidatus Acidoferrales bacterium]|nr:DUF1634 domain-containing protein [Candidatus Acidoferrales bacterium]